MRPKVTKPSPDLSPLIYLITPQGVVWTIAGTADIPESKRREEVTVTKNGGTTSTETRVITSYSEPVIDHFLANGSEWTKYGELKKSGEKYSLELISSE